MPSDFITLPHNRATRLDNLTCPYCGCRGSPDNPVSDEHVVGRRFVPKGAFAHGWNLIVRACQRCNNDKSDLEDDISAVTLQPALGTQHEDSALHMEASRKARGSYSRRTGKPVAESHEQHSVEGRVMSSLHASFGFTSPPQLDPERVRKLAAMHLRAFFYLMSYDKDRREGGFIPGDIGHVDQANRLDWGNPLMRGFADLTKAWPLRLSGLCAREFFKIVLRKEPADALLWSFALEWNANHRLIGFFGDMDLAQAHVDQLPELQWKQFGRTRRYRLEIPLDPADDILFSTPELSSSVD